MTRKINLTQGKVALVDDEDFDELNKFKWFARRDPKNDVWYAERHKTFDGEQKTIRMPHQITDFKYRMVDHINHNGLDNRRCNLRPCNYSQNNKNHRKRKDNTSGLIGVGWNKHVKKWRARIAKDKKKIFLGYFNDKEEAGRAVDKKALELFGEFAVLNFPYKKNEEML